MELGGTIAHNVNRLFTITVDVSGWNIVNQKYLLEEMFRCPYALAGYEILHQVEKWAKRKKIGSPVECFFESGDDGWGDFEKLCRRWGLPVPTDLPKGKTVAFQIGDMYGWKTRIAARNAVGGFRLLQQLPEEATEEDLDSLLQEMNSLNRCLPRYTHLTFLSPEALERTCKNNGIPRRG